MKKVFWRIAGICFLISFILVVTSCTPEQVQQFNDGMQYQLTDPTSPVQQTAGGVGQVAGTAQAVIAPVAAVIPYGTIIVAVLGVISGLCNLMQKMQSTKQVQQIAAQGTAIKEIVAGGENFKIAAKGTSAVELFKESQATAQQTAETRAMVAQVKAA